MQDLQHSPSVVWNSAKKYLINIFSEGKQSVILSGSSYISIHCPSLVSNLFKFLTESPLSSSSNCFYLVQTLYLL